MKNQGSLIIAEDDLMTLHACGGYYICPEGPNGELLGPLVGYAGKYADEGDLDGEGKPKQKQFIGKVYYNFAKVEENPIVMRHFAHKLAERIRQAFPDGVDYVMAMPMGGIAVAFMVAEILECQFVLAEKEITKVKTETSREESILKLDRHALEPGFKVVLVEDVCNNFSTTEKGIGLVQKAGSEVVALACIMNRSKQAEFNGLPVISMIHVSTEQFRQDDPKVAEHVQAGQVQWKPKKKESWPVLMTAMEAAAANKE